MIRANANSINTNARAWAYVGKEGKSTLLGRKTGDGCNWVMGPGCLGNLLLQALASGMISKGVFGKVQ